MRDKKMRSPLKENEVLRLPGTYLRSEIFDIAWYFSGFFTVWACLLILVTSEWNNYFNRTPDSPWITTSLFICFTIFLFYKYRKVAEKLDNYSLGLDGEIVVGQLLEGLRPYGYTPIHDIPCVGGNGKKFNIDHVLIGPKGVFVVETKTWSKIIGKNEKVVYKDDALYTGSRRRGDKEIVQTRNNAQWLGDLFKTRSGNNCEVSPILTFPGWYIHKDANPLIRKKYGVYILTPNAIGNYLATFDTILSDEQIQYFVKILSNYIYEQADLNLKN